MKEPKIIAIGDNVCDKYLSRGKMYPGGQCVNTCVYAKWNGVNSAYLGKYGNDEVAECVQGTLKKLEIDDTHCRHFQGENGFALVTLKQTVFFLAQIKVELQKIMHLISTKKIWIIFSNMI